MRKYVLITCVLIAAALASAAAILRALRLPPASGRILTDSSQDWASLPFNDGICAVVNNTWNRAAAGKRLEQTVFIEEISGHPAVGWRWKAPWSLPPTVVSQPQVVCGNKPWDPKTRPDDGFPFPVGAKRVTADFDARLQAHGVYNMVFTLWAVSALPASRRNISHEIMIWTAAAWLSPAGRRVDSIAVNGVNYSVYVEPHQTDASGQNANTWKYVAFVPARAVLRGPLDLSVFLDYLLRRGEITGHHYLTSLEFGNEVSAGAGVVEISSFALSVR